jgi:hypothetical protein
LIEEKEELERLIYSSRNTAEGTNIHSSISPNNYCTDYESTTVTNTSLSTKEFTPCSTVAIYELNGLQFNTHAVNELMEQQVPISHCEKEYD